MMRFLFLLCLVFPFAQAQAQTPLPPSPQPPLIQYAASDSLFISVEGNQKYLWHRFKQGESVYALSKFYGLHVHDLYACNPDLFNRSVRLNEWLKVPLAAKAIRREQPAKGRNAEFIPLYYLVKPSETMYRVARVHFKMPIELLRKRNKLKSDALNAGQALLVAWVSKQGVPDTLQQALSGLVGPVAEENEKWKKAYEDKNLDKSEKNTEGVAVWPKGEKLRDQVSLYALSPDLPIGSVVKLENPMFKRSIYAQISGRMPDNSETEGAILMLSPALARALGGLDQRFFVKMTYKTK